MRQRIPAKLVTPGARVFLSGRPHSVASIRHGFTRVAIEFEDEHPRRTFDREHVLLVDSDLYTKRIRATEVRVGTVLFNHGEALRVTAIQRHREMGKQKITFSTEEGVRLTVGRSWSLRAAVPSPN